MCHRKAKCTPSTCDCRGGKIERFIEPCILLLLRKNQPIHGYELIDYLAAYGVSGDSGALYRTLRRLEDDGMVISKWETHAGGPAKRIYEITTTGKDLLAHWITNFRNTKNKLDRFINEFEEIGSDD